MGENGADRDLLPRPDADVAQYTGLKGLDLNRPLLRLHDRDNVATRD
jgi:hypothetical protein